MGRALRLPRIEQPTDEDVARWHAAYVEALETMYDEHKAQFGFADRKLKIF